METIGKVLEVRGSSRTEAASSLRVFRVSGFLGLGLSGFTVLGFRTWSQDCS